MARKTTGKKPATSRAATDADKTDANKDTPAIEASDTPEPETRAAPSRAATDRALPDGESADAQPSDLPNDSALAPTDATSPEAETEGASDPAPSDSDGAEQADTLLPAASLSDPGPFSVSNTAGVAEDAANADATGAGACSVEAQPDGTDTADGPGAEDAPAASGPETAGEGAASDVTDAPKPAAPPPPPAPPPAKSGFFPMLLGGLVAGGIGYGAHFYTSQQDETGAVDPATVAALQDELTSLRADLDARPDSPEVAEIDLTPLETEIAELRAALAAQPAGADLTREDVAALIDPEIAQLRDALSGADDSAELAALSDNLADVQSRMAALEAAMADLRDLAENRVAAAEMAVETALARSGVEMMRAAIDLGAPYADALALMRDAGADVPDVLADAAQSGVPTLEALQESYPAAARAALRQALQGAPAESTTERLGNFLRAQVGARSTEPKDGDDPDAVLSRAGAAVEAGDLDGALSELDMLPEAAQAEMSGWRADARLRLDVDAALPEVIATYSNEQGSL